MGRPPRISREELLDTARRVFSAKGFEAATLADIARELHVTPAAVLRHARSKLELFRCAMHGRITAPPEFILDLVNVDARTDPRIVLRGIAERFVPFVEKVIAENIAIYMHNRARSIVMPFDPGAADSPPRRGIVIVSDYFRRAMDAGVIRHGDPRAAALLFMGSLQSYVWMHQVLGISPKPYPLDRYIDALLDLWSSGAIVGGHRGKAAQSTDARRRSRGHRSGSRAHAAVRARATRTKTADRVGNARSANRKRRLARRRTRDAHPDR